MRYDLNSLNFLKWDHIGVYGGNMGSFDMATRLYTRTFDQSSYDGPEKAAAERFKAVTFGNACSFLRVELAGLLLLTSPTPREKQMFKVWYWRAT